MFSHRSVNEGFCRDEYLRVLHLRIYVMSPLRAVFVENGTCERNQSKSNHEHEVCIWLVSIPTITFVPNDLSKPENVSKTSHHILGKPFGYINEILGRNEATPPPSERKLYTNEPTCKMKQFEDS